MKEEKKEIRDEAPFMFLLSLLGLVVGGALFLFYLQDKISTAFFVIAHAIMVAALLYGSKIFYQKGRDPRFYLLFMIFFATLGPVGSLISLITIAQYSIYGNIISHLDTLLSNYFPHIFHAKSTEIYERLIFKLEDTENELRPIPFQDIINFGSYKQKRAAIEKILRYFDPRFTPILTTALHDPSNTIRVQAAAAITAIDQHYYDAFLKLKEKTQQDPAPDKLLDLAKHCEVYANLEILDEHRARKMRLEAIKSYEEYLKHNPQTPEIWFALGKLHQQNGDRQKALSYLEKLTNQCENLPSHIYRWYMKSLFDNGKYDQLRTFCKQHPFQAHEEILIHDKVMEVQDLWANGLKPAEMQTEVVK